MLQLLQIVEQIGLAGVNSTSPEFSPARTSACCSGCACSSETLSACWFSIYFPEYRDVYRKPDAVTGTAVLKQAPLPADIRALGVDGILKIWREKKLRGAGEKRAKTLLSAAEHSIGSREAFYMSPFPIRFATQCAANLNYNAHTSASVPETNSYTVPPLSS